jgi:hypothetical protein
MACVTFHEPCTSCKSRSGRIKSVDKKASSRSDNWEGGGGGPQTRLGRREQENTRKRRKSLADTLMALVDEEEVDLKTS